MGIISYKPLIDDMIWSYSRIESYNDCPYRFFLRYIKRFKEDDRFYASYGSFIHRILERFYRGELTKNEMLTTFLLDFKKEVRGMRPKESTVQKYIHAGCEYLKQFVPFPFKMIDVEKRVEFKIGGYEFVGYIDYLGYDESDGTICIIDNKSRDLKPRSKKATPTTKDLELDKMLRQLYLYAVAIEQEYGAPPKLLCFNCFKSGVFIKEQFDAEKYEEAKRWAIDSIEKISQTEDFEPKQDFFSCLYICGVSDHCEYDIEAREERRRR